MAVAGLKECVETLAKKKGISKVSAEAEIKEVLEVIKEKCVDGGVSFKGIFVIKKVVKKGRTGVMQGKAYNTPDKNTLKITVGSEMEEALNQ